MRDERDFGDGVSRCLECGAAIVETERCGAVQTGEGRVLIVTGARQPEGSQPAVRVRCVNDHRYYVTLLGTNGGGFAAGQRGA